MRKTCCYFALLAMILLTGPSCLLTTHSFNHGKLLNPGEGLFSYGMGNKTTQVPTEEEKRYYYNGDYHYESVHDTISIRWRTYSLDYRLGFLSKYPFGKGMEIGLNMEWAYSTNFRYLVDGPPTLEFSGRFGFSNFEFLGGLLHHNMDLGWGIGYWVDNSWYAGYAAGLEFANVIPYGGVRCIYSATDALEKSTMDSTFFVSHDRSWLFRYTLGVSIKVPRTIILPDYVSPEISIVQSNSSLKRPLGITWQIGFRWLNGI